MKKAPVHAKHDAPAIKPIGGIKFHAINEVASSEWEAFLSEKIKTAKTKIKKNESVNAEVTITNSGKIKSDEVVQLYLTHLKSGTDEPLYSLKGFKRITLLPGASEKVKFTITPGMMKLVNEEGESVLNSGEIKINIGGSLPSQRSIDLGAAKPVEVVLTIESKKP